MKKQIQWITAVLLIGLMAVVPAAMAKGGGAKKQVAPMPDTVDSVDAASFQIKIATGQDKDKRVVVPYTVTAFTKIFVNDKPAKLEEVAKGMRVSVVSSDRKTATRVEAWEYAGAADKKPDDTKKK